MSNTDKPHRARKRFGQNFLHDQHVINQIVRSIHPQESDNLIEIGPGQGAITEQLLDHCQTLNVIELDRDLIPLLRARFGENPRFSIHQADALAFDFSQLGSEASPMRIVGNLPYNISTPLIFHLLSYAPIVKDMHFMLQREVVLRMAAGVNENNYGRLGIMTQYRCRVEHLFDVGPECFDPAPKVDSAIVRLSPIAADANRAQNIDTLDTVVKTAFNQRRKTLRNTLKSLFTVDELENLGINPTLRPENVAIDDYIRLANYLEERRTAPE